MDKNVHLAANGYQFTIPNPNPVNILSSYASGSVYIIYGVTWLRRPEKLTIFENLFTISKVEKI